MVSFPHVFQYEMSSLQVMGEVRKKPYRGTRLASVVWSLMNSILIYDRQGTVAHLSIHAEQNYYGYTAAIACQLPKKQKVMDNQS